MNHCPLRLQICKNESGSGTFHRLIETHAISRFRRITKESNEASVSVSYIDS